VRFPSLAGDLPKPSLPTATGTGDFSIQFG
jgi:hypothetical protein